MGAEEGPVVNAYTATPIVAGLPVKSSTHGSFGWSSVWMLRSADRIVVMDTGGPAYVPVLHERLAAHGLALGDVTDLVLTHAHWDHCANFTLFDRARVWIGDDELAWARRQVPGTHFLSELHVAELARRQDRDDGGLVTVTDEHEILPGIRALRVPGHTPGHLALRVDTSDGVLLFAGDSVKNIRELATATADLTMDEAASRSSIARLRDLMRTDDALLVPGHDAPLRADGDRLARTEPAAAQITFFGTADSPGADRSIRST
jgi:glyoxylase-like metal-dependent hydrolase (beta-lactamase superfamily II)